MTKVRSKSYQEKKSLVDVTRDYSPKEAVSLTQTTARTKFVGSIEAHLTLYEKDLKTTVKLPHGTGKTLHILVLASGDAAKSASKAGADFVGDNDLIKKISEGWLEFDALIATPEMMPKLAKLGKVLGPRGLMPNPKSGTMTQDPVQAIEKIKSGEIVLKSDAGQPTVHTLIGKTDFATEKLFDNLVALVQGVGKTKIKKLTVNSTMGPAVRVDISTL